MLAAFPACQWCIRRCTFVPYSNTQLLHPYFRCPVAACLSAPWTAKNLARASPTILIGIELWTKLGSGKGARASAPALSGPYTKLYNLPNGSTSITRQVSILQQRLALRLLLIIGNSHRSSAWPQFIFDRLRNAIRIVLLHNWPEKLTLVEPLRLSGEILSAL